MCTQDVVQYKCPCLSVSKEFHPCHFLQRKHPITCFFTSRRTLRLPQKCPCCLSKSVAKRTTRHNPLMEHIYKPKVEPYQITAEKWKAMKEGVTLVKDRDRNGKLFDDKFVVKLRPENIAALEERRRQAQIALAIPPVGKKSFEETRGDGTDGVASGLAVLGLGISTKNILNENVAPNDLELRVEEISI